MNADWMKYRPALLDGLTAEDLGLERTEAREFAVAESNLVDEYASGSLPTDERERFERCYLVTAERRENVAIAKGLLQMAAAARQRRWAAIGAAAALVVLAIGWFVFLRPVNDVVVLALSAGNTRSSVDLPVAALERIGETLVLEVQIEGGAPNCVATVTRVGQRIPELRVNVAAGRVVRIPMAREGLSEGEYLVVLQAGDSFQRDFLFRLEERR